MITAEEVLRPTQCAEAKENYDLVAGWQWTEHEEAEMKERRRIPIIMNRVGPYLDSVIGYQVNNRQELRFLPRGVEDAHTADLLSEVARWADDQCDAEDELSDAFADMLICGMGWTETRMDYKTNPDGILRTADRIDPLEMYWEGQASKRNISDATWIIRARRFRTDIAEKRWPKIAGITAMFSGADDDVRTEPHDSTNAWKYQGEPGGQHSPEDKFYLVLQHQCFYDETVYRVADPQSGQLITLSSDRFEKLRATFENMGVRYVKSSVRRYYQTWSTGDEMLEEGPAPSQKGFTLRSMCAKRDRNKHMWYGIVRPMRDPQKFSNKFFSDIMYILASNRKGGAFVESDALSDPRRAEEDWAKPDALIKVNPGGLEKIRERDAAIFPQGLDRLMQYAIDAVPATTGLNPELVGMADRDQPVGLETHRKRAGLTILAPLFDALKRHTRERGRVVMDMIRTYINDGRIIRITGQDGQQRQQPLIVPDAADYDIIVDEVSNSPNQKQETFAMMVQLAPFIQAAGIPLPTQLVDYLPLPSSLVDQWKQEIMQQKQKGPQPDPKVQVEQMKAQLQMQQAQMKMQQDKMKMEADQRKQQAQFLMDEQKNAATLQEMQINAAIKQKELEIKAAELQLKQFEIQMEAQTTGVKVQAQNFENVTDLKQAEIKYDEAVEKGKAQRAVARAKK